MDGYLYMLRCADGSYYTGSTTNLEVRLAQHQAGEGGAYTARRLPVVLVYSCGLPSPYEAFLRERQVKTWSRRKKEALIRGDYEALVELSRGSRRGEQPTTTNREKRIQRSIPSPSRDAIPSPSRDPSTGSG